MKARIIFEKTIENPYYQTLITIRMVKQEHENEDQYILEKLEGKDAMNNQIWKEVDSKELYLAIENFGEFFDKLKDSEFKTLNKILDQNKRLKELLEKVLAFNYRKETGVDFDVTGQGERLLKNISREVFNDNYLDDDVIKDLLKKYEYII